MAQIISEEMNYWLIRTYSGKYYAEFSQREYVALGWNEISDLGLIASASTKTKDRDILTELAKKLLRAGKNRQPGDDKKDQPGRITSPIMRFVNDINIGDTIIIPSADSVFLNFGKVTSDVFLKTDESILTDAGIPSLYKRRKVTWVKSVEKKHLDPYLFRLLNSHYAVTDANEYAQYIDRTMYGYYTKGERGHLVLEVKKESGIYGTELVDLINQILSLVDLTNGVNGTHYDKNSIEVKLTLNSPGLIELAGGIGIIGAVAVGATIMMGGKVNISMFRGVSLETTGIKGLIQQNKDVKLENRKLDIEEKKLEVEKLKFIETLARTSVQLPAEIGQREIPVAIEDNSFAE